MEGVQYTIQDTFEWRQERPRDSVDGNCQPNYGSLDTVWIVHVTLSYTPYITLIIQLIAKYTYTPYECRYTRVCQKTKSIGRLQPLGMCCSPAQPGDPQFHPVPH